MKSSMKMLVVAGALGAAVLGGASPAPAQQLAQQPVGDILDELAGKGRKGRQPGTMTREAATDIKEVQGAWSELCDKQPTKGRPVVTWTHNANTPICLRLRETMNTTILFPEWEEVVDLNIGDANAFAAEPQAERKNVLVLHTSNATVGADTSMVVVGKAVNGAGTGVAAPWGAHAGGRNVYTFYLRSDPTDSAVLPNVMVKINARRGDWRPELNGGLTSGIMVQKAIEAPAAATGDAASAGGAKALDDGVVATDGETPEYLREIPFDVAKLRFNDYEIQAKDDESRSLAPVRVFHDGVFTYLDFGEDGRSDRMLRPVVLRVIDSVDSKVNTRISGPKGNILVVEAVGTFTLRNGNRIVCVTFRGRPLDPPVGTDRSR